MNFEEREKLIEQLNTWEVELSVFDWQIENIEIWPIIKRNIFTQVYTNKKVNPVNENKTNKTHNIKSLLKNILLLVKSIFAHIYLKKIKKAEYIFTGASSHRVDYYDHSFNRYFDVILDHFEKSNKKGYLIEYSALKTKNIYKSNRVFDATSLYLVILKFNKPKINLDSILMDKNFQLLLSKIELNYGINKNNFIYQLKNNIQNIFVWSVIYKKIFLKTSPKYTFGLCYYNDEVFGMNLAANKLGIKSVDMQHGGQGSLHYAYKYSHEYNKKMALLPNVFWVWEKLSKDWLDKWNNNNNLYEVIIGGNPWVSSFDINKSKGSNKPIILYTIQKDHSIIEDYLIKVIKNSKNKFEWWFRLHPRMDKNDLKILTDQLKNNKIFDNININEATRLPLPVVLNYSFLHISKFSGSIAEAALMQVPSIITSKIGVEIYLDLIKNNQAVACLEEKELDMIEKIEKIYNNKSINLTDVNQKYNFKNTIDEYF